MKITPEREAAATRLAMTPIGAPRPRVSAAYLAAVKGMEADQNRVGVYAFPGLRFTDAGGDDGLAFVHPLTLDRIVMVSLRAVDVEGEEEAETEVTHAYAPGQARALAYALLVLADEAEADTNEVVS